MRYNQSMRFFSKKQKAKKPSNSKDSKKEDIEKKAVEGAKKALKEYQGVFRRLAEYDRV